MEGSFRIDEWLVEPHRDQLIGPDQRVKVEPRAMQVLLYLAERPGEVVSRQDILENVWEDTFVSDEVLTSAVKKLRRALGDDAGEPRYIQTVPGKGYRFVVPIERHRGSKGFVSVADTRESPYPGLAPFLEENAGFFFGREEEIDSVWNKLRRHQMLALVGPSGVGKSSFLRAGLIPARPEGWHTNIINVGDEPLSTLGEALDITEHSEEMLLCVDQFEELFTLHSEEVQSQFAELLERAASKLGIHVLVSLRDDFLMFCDQHAGLASVFTELTPLSPLKGAALRRALVTPAEKCGYTFEDESLVTDMLAEVAAERGALPLLAFAAARLWEKRDREKNLLMRTAYLEIGRVAGALARHADAAIERMSAEHQAMARETFRNLVTAHGTRVARQTKELLSVFEDRQSAEDILNKLVAARLLTSFETPGHDGEKASHRVEIIHESLLTAWPRLVRWQAQDAENTKQREELRQAAQMWDEHGRPEDLLWTGTAFLEFRLWRERYPGGLTELEESFGQAMVAKTERLKRAKRLAVTAVLVLSMSVAVVTGTLWRQAEEARQRSEASKLLALGQLELDDQATAALAYSIASLEIVDTPQARRFALGALWRGPTGTIVPIYDPKEDALNLAHRVAFSPNGAWFAVEGFPGNGRLLSADGQTVQRFGEHQKGRNVRFGPHSNQLLSGGGETIRFWSVPAARELRSLEFDQFTGFELRGSQLFTYTLVGDGRVKGDRRVLMQTRRLEGDNSRSLGHFEAVDWSLDPTGKWLAYVTDQELYVAPVEELTTAKPRLVGTHEEPVRSVTWSPDGHRIASVSEKGTICIWSRTPDSKRPLRILEGATTKDWLAFDPSGSFLAASSGSQTVHLWDLTAPPGSNPTVLKRGDDTPNTHEVTFHPTGRWLASANHTNVTFWPMSRRYPHVLRSPDDRLTASMAFTEDGNWLAVASHQGSLWLVPLSPEVGAEARLLLEDGVGSFPEIKLDARRQQLLVPGTRGRLWLVPLEGGLPRALSMGPSVDLYRVALSPDGRRLATGIGAGSADEKVIRVLDLESDDVQVLGPMDDAGDVFEGGTFGLAFTPDGRLVSVGTYGLYLWDLEDGSFELLEKGSLARGWGDGTRMTLSPDGHWVLVSRVAEERGGTLTLYDLEGGGSRALTSYGTDVPLCVAFDPTGEFMVTADHTGVIRVGSVTGGEPHLFLGHEHMLAYGLTVSPDGQWLASSDRDGDIRLWPMPNPDEPPFHTLPHNELLDRLRALTNLRAVPDETSSTGYKLEPGPFPGWKNVPTW